MVDATSSSSGIVRHLNLKRQQERNLFFSSQACSCSQLLRSIAIVNDMTIIEKEEIHFLRIRVETVVQMSLASDQSEFTTPNHQNSEERKCQLSPIFFSVLIPRTCRGREETFHHPICSLFHHPNIELCLISVRHS